MDRTEKALGYFFDGYNCAQSVMAAYCDIWGIAEADGLRLAAGFGGGVGGMRGTCGTVNAIVMLAGISKGYDKDDLADKKDFYKTVTQCVGDFENRFSTVNCGELLLKAKIVAQNTPSQRDEKYYQSRPCTHFVEAACGIVESRLLTLKAEEKRL